MFIYVLFIHTTQDEWLSNINVHQLSPTLRKIGPCGCTRGGEREMDHMIGGIARIFKLGIRHWQAVDAIVIFFQRFDDTEGSYCFGGQKGEMTEVHKIYMSLMIYKVK